MKYTLSPKFNGQGFNMYYKKRSYGQRFILIPNHEKEEGNIKV